MLALLIASPAMAKKKKTNDGNAIITFTKESHDFGIISDDKGAVSTEFEFINQGNAPLVIFSATADCGCTRPEYPKNPVAPGKRVKSRLISSPKVISAVSQKTLRLKATDHPRQKC